MDQNEAYENARFIPDGADYPARWAAAAQAFRASQVGADLNLPYGDSPRQALDLFWPQSTPRGLVVVVHGGYWMAFGRGDFSQLAAGAVARGWAVAMPSYDLCPDVGIPDITAQIARAIDTAAARVAGPIHLTGHSAGGHLVARMGCDDVPLTCRDRIARIVPVSPLADLRVLAGLKMNATLGLTTASATTESPALHPAPVADVHIWLGGDERPGFFDQADILRDAWAAQLTVDPGRHHFDVIEGLEQPDTPLMEALVG